MELEILNQLRQKFLLRNCADQNAECDDEDWRSLMTASQNGHFEIVKFLVEKGVDLNIKSEHGETAVIIACKWSEFVIARYLVNNDANPNARDDYGWGPVETVIRAGNLEMVKFLVQNGTDPNALFEHETPLIRACCDKQFEIVKFLIEIGVDLDVNFRDDWLSSWLQSKCTALVNAYQYGFWDIAIYLIEHGAKANTRILNVNLNEEVNQRIRNIDDIETTIKNTMFPKGTTLYIPKIIAEFANGLNNLKKFQQLQQVFEIS